MVGIETVSYTHLDVYKRQLIDRIEIGLQLALSIKLQNYGIRTQDNAYSLSLGIKIRLLQSHSILTKVY